MATVTVYTKSMASDFGGSVIPSVLCKEILAHTDIHTAPDAFTISGDVVSLGFRDALDALEQVALATVIEAHTGIKVDVPPEVSISGNVKSERVPTQGSRYNAITHNFTDKRTWWSNSAAIEEEILSDSGDGLSFVTIHKPIVDMAHGRVFGEHEKSVGRLLVCTSDGVPLTEKDKHTGVGDYVCDYLTGTITFDSSQAGKSVKLSYHKVQTSLFTIKPKAGKKITIGDVETQFSADYDIRDSVIFQPRAIVELAAPAMAVSNGGPVPDGTLIPVASPTIYNTEDDFIRESNGSFPQIYKSTHPDAAGNWRMNSQDRQGYPWRYKAGIVLHSSIGAQIDIYLEHDTPFGGEEATATLYCLSEDE